MAETEEKDTNLMDMNGNKLRVGDLIMVVLKQPFVTGYITEINEPSALEIKKGRQFGVINVTAPVRVGFEYTRQSQILQSVAKVIDPNSERLVDAIMDQKRKAAADIKLPPPEPTPDEKEPESETPPGPVLVDEPVPEPTET